MCLKFCKLVSFKGVEQDLLSKLMWKRLEGCGWIRVVKMFAVRLACFGMFVGMGFLVTERCVELSIRVSKQLSKCWHLICFDGILSLICYSNRTRTIMLQDSAPCLRASQLRRLWRHVEHRRLAFGSEIIFVSVIKYHSPGSYLLFSPWLS